MPRSLIPHFFLLLALAGSPCALGKSVRVKWKPLPGAQHYELQIGHGAKVVTEPRIPATQTAWQGEFEPGFYYYRLRGIEASGTAGEWADWKIIVVWPGPPQIEFPAAGSTVRLADAGGKLVLTWKTASRMDGFNLEWQRQPVDKVTLDVPGKGNSHEILDPKPGLYRWRLRAFLTAEDSLPAHLKKRATDASSAWTQWSPFRVEK